ncbi:MAG: Rossmann-like and DUF2520 domain-containing protein [Lachnospiraceae bacterium]
MRIGFIGAGKVGFSLGRYFRENDVCVSGYYSRNPKSSREAADFTKTKYYEASEDLIKESDTLFLTVPDGNIHKVYSEIIQSDIEGKILVHCSGALSSMVFSGISGRGAYGYSIHPICAVSDKLTGYHDLSKAYFTIEGEFTYLQTFKELFCRLGNPVEIITPQVKVKYHAAAVFSSNLVTGLYFLASKMLKSCGLSEDFSNQALLPLFMGNVKNVASQGVMQSLTGPVERADRETIEKHLAALTGEEEQIYRLLSLELVKIAEEKNPERDYENIWGLLQDF